MLTILICRLRFFENNFLTVKQLKLGFFFGMCGGVVCVCVCVWGGGVCGGVCGCVCVGCVCVCVCVWDPDVIKALLWHQMKNYNILVLFCYQRKEGKAYTNPLVQTIIWILGLMVKI